MRGNSFGTMANSLTPVVVFCLGSLLAGCSRTATPSPEPVVSHQAAVTPADPLPIVNKHLYSVTADPKADIAAASVKARTQHKRIILDFGGDWCGDCMVLDYYYHQSPNAELLDKNFVLVHIDIGHMDHNVDIAQKYNVPITKGVPALAVLDSNGKLLYAERAKEFEQPTPEAITALLNRWKS
jgi:thiol:disulfide interchange protein